MIDPSYAKSLESMSLHQLREEMDRARRDNADALRRMAAVVLEHDRREADVRGLGLSSREIANLRKIGASTLSVSALIRFNDTDVLRYVAAMPVAEQERLASGGSVQLAIEGDDQRQELDPLKLTEDELERVFDLEAGRLRGRDEQLVHLSRQRRRAAAEAERPIAVSSDYTPQELEEARKRARHAGLSLTAFQKRATLGTL